MFLDAKRHALQSLLSKMQGLIAEGHGDEEMPPEVVSDAVDDASMAGAEEMMDQGAPELGGDPLDDEIKSYFKGTPRNPEPAKGTKVTIVAAMPKAAPAKESSGPAPKKKSRGRPRKKRRQGY